MFGYFLFKAVLSLYVCLNWLAKLLFGRSFFSGRRADRRLFFTQYQVSAHVLKVVLRRRKFELEAPKLKHFILRHDRYTHPEIALGPNVSLMAIERRFAVFAVCDEGVDVFKHTTGPFLYINQFEHCTRLIRIPLDFFVQLGLEAGGGGDDLKMVLLSNTGRCGSTLLTQMFEQMPRTVAISEPEVVMEFSHSRTTDEMPRERRDELLRCCVHLLCLAAARSKPDEPVDCVLIKPKTHGVLVAKDFARLFPRTKHLFMYRHPVEYVKSIRSVFRSLLHPVARQLMLYLAFDMKMEQFIMRQFTPPTKEQVESGNYNKYYSKMRQICKEADMSTDDRRFAAMFCGNLMSVLQMVQEEKIVFHTVSYHQLKKQADDDMTRIKAFCGIDQGRSCLLPDRDAQNNSGLSQKSLHAYHADVTKKEVERIDEILTKSGFPACEKFPLEADRMAELLGLPYDDDDQ